MDATRCSMGKIRIEALELWNYGRSKGLEDWVSGTVVRFLVCHDVSEHDVDD